MDKEQKQQYGMSVKVITAIVLYCIIFYAYALFIYIAMKSVKIFSLKWPELKAATEQEYTSILKIIRMENLGWNEFAILLTVLLGLLIGMVVNSIRNKRKDKRSSENDN